MAIGYLNVAIIGRSSGRSAVAAAAYASRTDLVDERTGTAYRYARKQADVVHSFVWLPKDAPERLRDRTTLWNEVEKSETRKNSQTARRIIMALPHELTPKQQQLLLQDFVRENFTRKGLAVDASIHAPDAAGDDRNHHAHLLIPTRFIDRNGLNKKDRKSNAKSTGLEAWKAAWVKLANRQLERYGHAARITFEVAEGQEPQHHMGPQATALERKGVETRAGDELHEIVTDNMQPAGNDNRVRPRAAQAFNEAAQQPAPPAAAPPVTVQQPQDWTAGKAFAREVVRPANDNAPPPRDAAASAEPIDRDRQNAEWQDSIDRAAIAYAEERRRQLQQAQTEARAAFARQGEAMGERHAASWARVGQRHHAETVSLFAEAVSGYQPGTMAEAEQAVSGGAAFLFGLFTSWAEAVTRSVSGSKGPAQPKGRRGFDKAKEHQAQRQAEQLREAHSRELEAMMQEQAQERAAYERRRSLMLFQQAGAMQSFEQSVQDKSSVREAFERHTEVIDAYKARDAAEKRQPGRDREGPGLDLG